MTLSLTRPLALFLNASVTARRPLFSPTVTPRLIRQQQNHNQNHHDLHTFLAYAERTALSPKTTTYIGTRYEYLVRETLRRYGFQLARVGGANDVGIDLVGTWDPRIRIRSSSVKERDYDYGRTSADAQEQRQERAPASAGADADAAVPPVTSPSSASSSSDHPTTTADTVPALPHPLRVLVQCKALNKKVGPNFIRELEGTFTGAPVGWRGEGVFGILASTREATRGVRDAMAKSRFPLMWFL
ncbi:hypothetical protein KEM55_005760, partial [Ascosphaera atra]